MVHNRVKRWVAPEFARYVDRVHDELRKKNIIISKEDVTRIIQVMLEYNGIKHQTIVILRESKLRSRGKTHEIEERPYGTFEIPEMRLCR